MSIVLWPATAIGVLLLYSGSRLQENQAIELPPYLVTAGITRFVSPLQADGRPDWSAQFVGRDSEIAPGDNSANLLIPVLPMMADDRNGILTRMGLDPEQVREITPLRPLDARLTETLEKSVRCAWNPERFPEIDNWLNRNDSCMPVIYQAAQMGHYRPALVVPGEPLAFVTLPDLQEFPQMIQMLQARASRHLGAGKTDEAVQDVETILNLARQLESGSCLIVAVAGSRYHRSACDTMAVLVSQKTDLMSGQWSELMERWGHDCRAIDPQIADIPERALFLDGLDHMTRSENQRRTGYEIFSRASSKFTRLQRKVIDVKLDGIEDWSPVFRSLNRDFDELVDALETGDPQQRVARLQKIVQRKKTINRQLDSWAGTASGPVFVSATELAIAMTFTSGWDLAEAVCNSEAETLNRHRLVWLGLALRRYQQEHGSFPDSLEPVQDAEPLLDLFTGQPFQYELTESGFRLYSVGSDGIDDKFDGTYDEAIDDWGLVYPNVR